LTYLDLILLQDNPIYYKDAVFLLFDYVNSLKKKINEKQIYDWYIRVIVSKKFIAKILSEYILKNPNSHIEKSIELLKREKSLINEEDIEKVGIKNLDIQNILELIRDKYYIEYILYNNLGYQNIKYTKNNILKYVNMFFELDLTDKKQFIDFIDVSVFLDILKESEYFQDIKKIKYRKGKKKSIFKPNNIVEDSYMNTNIKNLRSCNLRKKIAKSDINYTKIRNILSVCNDSVYNLEAISCLFREYLITNFTDQVSVLPMITKDSSNYLKFVSQINDTSSQGIVKFIKFLDDESPEIVIKETLNSQDYKELIREYYVGIECCNNLREITPCFMYTYFGVSNLGPTNINIAYEKIEGESLAKFLKNPNLTFEQFFSIYGQILLALEVAQRKYKYAHYDLHGNNIIIRKCPTKYSIFLDDKEYRVNSEYVPVMIDYGFSTFIDKKEYTYGINGHQDIGIYNFLLQGRDVYQLLIISIFYMTNDALKEQLINMLYYENDPYAIKKTVQNAPNKRDLIKSLITDIVSEYFVNIRPIKTLKNGRYIYQINDVIRGTPLQMFEEFMKTEQNTFSVSSRNKYLAQPVESKLSIINSMLTKRVFTENDIIDNLVEKISSKLPYKESYLGYLYIAQQLSENKTIETYSEFNNHISNLHSTAEKYISNDIEILSKFKETDIDTLDDILKKLSINHNITKFIRKYIKNMENILNLLYISKDIKVTIHNSVKNSLNEAKSSLQYQKYINDNMNIKIFEKEIDLTVNLGIIYLNYSMKLSYTGDIIATNTLKMSKDNSEFVVKEPEVMKFIYNISKDNITLKIKASYQIVTDNGIKTDNIMSVGQISEKEFSMTFPVIIDHIKSIKIIIILNDMNIFMFDSNL